MNTQDPRYRPFSLVQRRSRNSLRGFKGVGLQFLAFAAQQTPSSPLLWGWSLLCKAGISVGINLDKTRNTRKVGNIVA